MRNYGWLITLLLISSQAFAGRQELSGLDLMTSTLVIAKADAQGLEMSAALVDKNPYTVQVASYVSETDAIHHVAQLKNLEKASFYFPTFTRGQVWYKVCSGRFANLDTAEVFRKALVKKSDEPFAVVISLQTSAAPERGTASVPESPKSTKKNKAWNLQREAVAVPVQAPQNKVAAPVEGESTQAVEQKEVLEHSAEEPKAAAKKADADDMHVKMIKTAAVQNDLEATDVIAAPPVKHVNKSDLNEDYQYTVQIASYAKKEEAVAKSTTLAKEGRVSVKESQVQGKTWYRVYLGEFETKREADAFRSVYAERSGDLTSFVKRLDK